MATFADSVVEQLLPETFESVQKLLNDAKIKTPTHIKTSIVETAFLRGVPTDADVSLGDLINAAWRVFRLSGSQAANQQGSPFLENLSDLVFKSIEIYEIKKYLQ